MKVLQDDTLLQQKLEQFGFDAIFTDVSKVPFTLASYEAGEVMLAEGEPLDYLIYLVEGKVKATASVGNGKSLLLRFNHPLSILGDIEFVRKIPIQSQIAATTHCLCLNVPFDYLRRTEKNNAAFYAHLVEHVTYKLQTNTASSRVNLLAAVDQRFASYLLSVNAGDNFGDEMHTEHVAEIADLLGTSHRHLNRVIKRFLEEGIIEKYKKQIRIIDEARLEEISQGVRYE